MPTVLLHGRISAQYADFLRGELDDNWQVLVWDPDKDPIAAFAPLAAQAEAIVGAGIPTDAWPATPKLKLFQIPFTGYDWTSPARMPAGVPVCNCFEHETAIAEYVLLAMLEWRIGLRHMDATFRAKGWNGEGPALSPYHGEVRDSTVGIVGYGHIGAEVATRAAAFGMRVIGVRRTPQPTPAPLDWLGTLERLDELLAESDFVLVACDLNDSTRGLIDEAKLARMKSTGVIINVARGAVIEEAPLYAALKEKRIGGAVIDVWYNYFDQGEPEVWPCNEPFQELDNVILSAHQCGWTLEQVERRWRFVAANLKRLAAGEPLENQIFVGTGG